jgi:uncharacterized protein YodC (DUF2158 family)
MMIDKLRILDCPAMVVITRNHDLYRRLVGIGSGMQRFLGNTYLLDGHEYEHETTFYPPTNAMEHRGTLYRVVLREVTPVTPQAEPPPSEEKKWTPRVGDVMKLRSGGPRMTVINVTDQITCAWFTSEGEHREGIFLPGALEPAP